MYQSYCYSGFSFNKAHRPSEDWRWGPEALEPPGNATRRVGEGSVAVCSLWQMRRCLNGHTLNDSARLGQSYQLLPTSLALLPPT